MVFVYLNEYFCEFCRLDSGGETSPKATFLATTLGPRRLFISLIIEAISSPKVFRFFLKKITLEIEKIFLNSRRSAKGKKSLFSEQEFDVKGSYFFAENPSPTADFYAAER